MPARWEVSDKIALLRQHDNGVPWTRLAAESGVSLRTLSRWARAYRADSTSHGLARRQRSDHGRRRIPTELIEIVEALALAKPAPTVAFVHRRVAGIAHDRGLSAPSYSSVRSLVTGIDPGLRALAEHGDAGYRDRFELVLRRSAERPNEQWQVDHTLLDVAILGAKGTQVRPWLTVVLDDYSRAVAGYTLFLGAPSAEQTALALHQAVNAKTNPGWPVCGLPEVLYSDHGSDFTSARLEQVCLDTHIRLIHSRVGVPQGRGEDRTVLPDRHHRAPAAPARVHPARHERCPGHDPGADARRPRRHRRAVRRRRVQHPPSLPDPPGAQRPVERERLHPAQPRPPRRSRPAPAHRGHHPQGPARRHPVRLDPLPVHSPGRLRRGAGHRPLQPARRRGDPRVLQRRVLVPGDRPRAIRRVNLPRPAPSRPPPTPPRPQAPAPPTPHPRQRPPRRHPLHPTSRQHRRHSTATGS